MNERERIDVMDVRGFMPACKGCAVNVGKGPLIRTCVKRAVNESNKIQYFIMMRAIDPGIWRNISIHTCVVGLLTFGQRLKGWCFFHYLVDLMLIDKKNSNRTTSGSREADSKNLNFGIFCHFGTNLHIGSNYLHREEGNKSLFYNRTDQKLWLGTNTLSLSRF